MGNREVMSLGELAKRINAEHEAATLATMEAFERWAKVGESLAEAKAQVPHGEWGEWVEANCRFGARQARKYMQIHERRAELEKQNGIRNSVLTIDKALASLAAPPEPDPAELKIHPFLSAVLDMTDAEFDRLCRSILADGLLDPIITFKGWIIDGRQRLRACQRVGVEPRFKEWDGEAIPDARVYPEVEDATKGWEGLDWIRRGRIGRPDASDAERVAAYILASIMPCKSFTGEQRREIEAKIRASIVESGRFPEIVASLSKPQRDAFNRRASEIEAELTDCRLDDPAAKTESEIRAYMDLSFGRLSVNTEIIGHAVQ